MMLTDLPDVLRAAGVPVVEVAGWEFRTTRTRTFHPRYVVWHHDASPKGNSPGVVNYMLANYASHGAQLWVDRQGVWYVLSCNRANHAGAVRPGMPGNEDSYGVETDHTTGEDWPPAQLNSLRKGTAAILAWLNKDEKGLHFHKTICSPPGRKVDPDGLDLGTERVRVGMYLQTRNTKIGSDEVTQAQADRIERKLDEILRQFGKTGENGEWNGWPQLDGKTVVDFLAEKLK